MSREAHGGPRPNLFADLPERLDAEVLEVLAQGAEVTIERILSRGQCSPAHGWYDQDRHEWVVLLQGRASIAFASGERVDLGAGDYLHIPAHCRHRVAWTDPAVTSVWLAIHYSSAPGGASTE